MAEGRAPEFLTLQDVLGFHRSQLDSWGGQEGVRDLGESWPASETAPRRNYRAENEI